MGCVVINANRLDTCNNAVSYGGKGANYSYNKGTFETHFRRLNFTILQTNGSNYDCPLDDRFHIRLPFSVSFYFPLPFFTP